MTAPEDPDTLPRRGWWSVDDEMDAITNGGSIDVAPTAVAWIRAVTAATATDSDTLLRIREGLVKL